MKVAYFSPFNPLKSGISDFSEELVVMLKKYVDVDIFVDGYTVENCEILDKFDIYDIKDYYKEDVRSRYDTAVFHVGNNLAYHRKIIETFLQFGGILELHDVAIHNLVRDWIFDELKAPEKYIEVMRYCHGKKGEKTARDFIDGKISPPWTGENSLKYTLNKFLVDKAFGVIVHSDMAKQMLCAVSPNVPVITINHHVEKIYKDNFLEYKLECRKKLGFYEDVLIMGAFGYATKTKRIIETLDALGRYKKNKNDKFIYLIVGKVDGIDVDSKISEYGMEKNVIITGFTELEDFKTYMGACDFCLNLRYPTQGETSGSLHRMLGMGKPILVSRVGTFEEYPDDIVIKIRHDNNEIDDIYNNICALTENSDEILERGKKAVLFADKYCNIDENAKKYAKFFREMCNGSYQDDYLDYFIGKMFSLGIVDDEYIRHISGKVSSFGIFDL